MGPISYGTTYGYNDGRGTGSSAPKDYQAASAVKDYVTAAAYLGTKHDRPLMYATRLRRVAVRYAAKAPKRESRGIAVVHHGTPVIVWREDGLTEFLAYGSVTTKQRLNRYLPFHVGNHRGELAVWGGWNRNEDWPRTARRIGKCRTCSGRGKHGPNYCNGNKRQLGYYSDSPKCGRGNRDDRHAGHYYFAPVYTEGQGYECTTAGFTYPDAVPCDDCNGLGSRNYGSQPIPFTIEHGNYYLVASGRIAGHAGNSGRWEYVPAPVKVKPVRVDKRPRIGEITAYRGWNIAYTNQETESDAGLSLIGIGIGNRAADAYDSFNLSPAVCLHNDSESHVVPAAECGCGYWSVKDRDDIPTSDVQGVVKLWGRYVEHRHGFRSERMTLDYLIVGSESARAALSRRYPDVPIYSSWSEADYRKEESSV